jgi:sec-independent protein translocase protein TatA
MWELLLIALVILLFFGASRIPDMMRGLAKGLRGFKDELKGEEKPEEKPKAS